MSRPGSEARPRRLAEIVGAVTRQALRDWGAGRVALLDDGSPEAELAARWLVEALPAGALQRVAADDPQLESVLRLAGADVPRETVRLETARLLTRLLPDTLPALPANKTALLLGGVLPPEPLLPLGDLFASEVAELTGGWSAPPEVRILAERAGGVERLDAALRAWFDARDPDGLEALPPASRREVHAALSRGLASRVSFRIVPKIGHRTLGVDLFE